MLFITYHPLTQCWPDYPGSKSSKCKCARLCGCPDTEVNRFKWVIWHACSFSLGNAATPWVLTHSQSKFVLPRRPAPVPNQAIIQPSPIWHKNGQLRPSHSSFLWSLKCLHFWPSLFFLPKIAETYAPLLIFSWIALQLLLPALYSIPPLLLLIKLPRTDSSLPLVAPLHFLQSLTCPWTSSTPSIATLDLDLAESSFRLPVLPLGSNRERVQFEGGTPNCLTHRSLKSLGYSAPVPKWTTLLPM